MDDGPMIIMPCPEYEEYPKPTYTFRVPKNEGFWFGENESWIFEQGDMLCRALLMNPI